MKIRVMVFGTFDRLHPGHRDFLRQAGCYGDELIVVVARDATVLTLKKRRPQQSERSRLQSVVRLAGVRRAVLGDRILGTYGVIHKWEPRVVCVGYDQQGLERDLRKRLQRREFARIRIVRMKPHHPEKFHSSLIKVRETWYNS